MSSAPLTSQICRHLKTTLALRKDNWEMSCERLCFSGYKHLEQRQSFYLSSGIFLIVDVTGTQVRVRAVELVWHWSLVVLASLSQILSTHTFGIGGTNVSPGWCQSKSLAISSSNFFSNLFLSVSSLLAVHWSAALLCTEVFCTEVVVLKTFPKGAARFLNFDTNDILWFLCCHLIVCWLMWVSMETEHWSLTFSDLSSTPKLPFPFNDLNNRCRAQVWKS